ncbi:hypothetical protein GCM10007063_18960 [Lentibacillus kapialis]|uniref:Uncharacterized protein n=1 Tax=Lentibacillus kapialis TaxID=340214 RepID=A0A917UYI2_9BACI|nr:hypothetical protein GCM10007063_18960 [Lentibacillus kapialis]
MASAEDEGNSSLNCLDVTPLIFAIMFAGLSVGSTFRKMCVWSLPHSKATTFIFSYSHIS